jgi:hypothetical protein
MPDRSGGPFNRDPLIALDLVARLHVVVIPDANSALSASPDFADVILEAPE